MRSDNGAEEDGQVAGESTASSLNLFRAPSRTGGDTVSNPWCFFVFVSSSSPAGGSPVRVAARRPGSRLAAGLETGRAGAQRQRPCEGGATMRSVA